MPKSLSYQIQLACMTIIEVMIAEGTGYQSMIVLISIVITMMDVNNTMVDSKEKKFQEYHKHSK